MRIVAAFKRLWLEDTKWAELFGALGIFAWGFLHLALPPTPGPHTFGVGMGWITRTHLEWALMIGGGVQMVTVVYGTRLLRMCGATPAVFLTLDIVLDVLLKGEFPPGATAMFGVTCVMNIVSVIRNGQKRRAEAARHVYA